MPKSTLILPETITYKHTQHAKAITLMLVVPLLVSLSVARFVPTLQYTMYIVAGLIGTLAGLFSVMTIRVSDRFVHWSFGPGFMRRKIALAQIQIASITRTTWLEGWGIHYTGRGWLYNVGGFDALHITLKDGSQVLLGSNDVDTLHQAISASIRRLSNN